jgi:dihydroorotase-like cyclic amidohydrolase
LADVFAQAVDLPRSVGDVAAAIVLAALPGAVDSWVHRRAPRREIEETLTLMITGGVALVAARLPAAQPAVP